MMQNKDDCKKIDLDDCFICESSEKNSYSEDRDSKIEKQLRTLDILKRQFKSENDCDFEQTVITI